MSEKMTEPTDPWKLLREAIDWMQPRAGERALQEFVAQIDAALAAHEAEPERKCRTCKHRRVEVEHQWCGNLDGPIYCAPTMNDWFCADWQLKEGK